MSLDDTRRTTGMIIGKFMPPHLGHLYLVDFARHYCDELTIVVCSLEREPIPGKLRVRWMHELAGGARVVHLSRELPQTPEEHPRFWQLWQDALQEVMPYVPDLVFASESYGQPLADLFDARFVPADPGREITPVSATMIRDDPMAHFDYLPPCVRAHFVRRVCLFGPESTGKTTLARALAEHFETVWVPEYARTLLERKGGAIEAADMPAIARGQIAAEEALARRANRVLFCDTDPLLTTIWSEVLFSRCDPVLERLAERAYDLYLLTDVDVPWVEDPVRYLPEERASFFARCQAVLDARGLPYVTVRGEWGARLRRSREAVESLLRPVT